MNPNEMLRTSIFSLIVAVGMCSLASSSTAASDNLTEISVPAEPGSAEPSLTLGHQGTIVLSWQETAGEVSTVRYAEWTGSGWSKPRMVSGGENRFVNWADFPSVVRVSDTLWAAHWLAKQTGGTYAYDVAVALSADGENWTDGFTPHTDNTATEHGFVSLFPWHGALGAIWLDGRNALSSDDDSNGKTGHGSGGAMTLRSALIAADGSLSLETQLDDRVCDCCQTSVAMTTGGPVVVYRNRTEDEVRDIYIARNLEGHWLPGRAVHDDGWIISGCPVNGPAVAANGDNVVVAWFTMANDQPRVLLARSIDGGESFSKPTLVDDTDPTGRVDVALLGNGEAVVSWMDGAAGGQGSIRMKLFAANGQPTGEYEIARTTINRPAGFPQLAFDGKTIVIAWTDTGSADGLPRVRSAILGSGTDANPPATP